MGRKSSPQPPAPRIGWFVLAGSETDEFRDDPSNFVPVTQRSLFDRICALDSGLEGPIGTIMVWDEEGAEYRVRGDSGPLHPPPAVP